MKVNVKLTGALSQRYPEYQPTKGLDIHIKDGATVKDLINALNIVRDRSVAVTLSDRILSDFDCLEENAQLKVIQVLEGG